MATKKAAASKPSLSGVRQAMGHFKSPSVGVKVKKGK